MHLEKNDKSNRANHWGIFATIGKTPLKSTNKTNTLKYFVVKISQLTFLALIFCA